MTSSSSVATSVPPDGSLTIRAHQGLAERPLLGLSLLAMLPFYQLGTVPLGAGDRIGPYVLQESLGEGAMGLVFRAAREPDGGVVALKLLKPELSANDTYRRRFLHEARSASRIEHRHLVTILDAGEADGHHYLAVRYVSGGTLHERIEARGPLALPEALRLVAQVGSALDALHGAGIVHRDIKPSNIMLDADGSAALTDFGLAKGQGYTALTRPGQVLGTFDYMAPEMIQGKGAQPCSDIYSLGCVLYECLAGKPPFAGLSLFQLAMAHLEEDPPKLEDVRPEVSSQLAWAVMQAMAKDPAQRPPTATAYANVLSIAVRGT